MKIELLYFDNCPSYQSADAYITEIIKEEAIDADYELIEVQTDKRGQTSKFLGSPTILVNGKDIEQDIGEAKSFELTCRIYKINGTFAGYPSKKLIRNAILSHVEFSV